MQWHRLPPRGPDDCPHRGRVERTGAGETAVCGLVRAALPLADEAACRAPRDACAACAETDPPTPAAWNTVVATLVYRAATNLTAATASGPEAAAQAAAAREYAAARLRVIHAEPPPEPEALPPFAGLRDLIPPPPTRGRRITSWAVGITTAPRREPTLARCLDGLARAGWDAPHLFMDGAVRVPDRFGHLPGTLRSPAAGAWPNHYLALLELTLRHPEADAYMLLQDDALMYDGENVREYLEKALWPGGAAAIVSLFCPEPYTARRFGWHRFRRPWVWGAQAYIFSRAVAQRYLADRRVCRHRWRSARGGLTQIDVVLGRWAWWRRIPVWFPTPSLVQHVGDVSTLWPGSRAAGPRAASQFAGGPRLDGTGEARRS